jgi:hypothetical protein
MRSRSESSKIREVQVLGNQESLILLRRFPNLAVTLATQVFFGDGALWCVASPIQLPCVDVSYDPGQLYTRQALQLLSQLRRQFPC